MTHDHMVNPYGLVQNFNFWGPAKKKERVFEGSQAVLAAKLTAGHPGCQGLT